jgi:hypothetical protein
MKLIGINIYIYWSVIIITEDMCRIYLKVSVI